MNIGEFEEGISGKITVISAGLSVFFTDGFNSADFGLLKREET